MQTIYMVGIQYFKRSRSQNTKHKNKAPYITSNLHANSRFNTHTKLFMHNTRKLPFLACWMFLDVYKNKGVLYGY